MNKQIAWFALGAVAFLTAACETPPRRPPPMRVHSSSQLLGVADVKMLAKSGISDEVILSQIRNTHTVYHLSAAEILDLKDNNVSEKVIDFMINTPAIYQPTRPPPPPPSY